MMLLLLVLQAAVLSASSSVPYEAGLRLSWASSHSGEPDYESVLTVTSVEPEEATFRISWNRGTDHRWKAVERPLSRRERQLGRSFYHYAEAEGTNEFRGYAFAMTTQAVLKDLKEKGGAEVALLFPEVARTPHRGTLTRMDPEGGVGTFSVLMDGKQVSLPAVRARGVLTNPMADPSEVTGEFVFLDDADAAWMLDSRITSYLGEGRKLLVQVASRASSDALEDELRDECRATVHDLYFATGSVEMEDASAPTIQRIAEILTANPEWQLTLVGHTDDIGTPESNLDLSRRRAERVRELLVTEHGIGAARLKAEGRGETQPMEANGTPEGRARNRRVGLERACG
ncbi:MAG: OmpA family protein [Longimicrobiales bacterium]|nr:OmpA family protein [Longimicrobiales bacterium]